MMIPLLAISLVSIGVGYYFGHSLCGTPSDGAKELPPEEENEIDTEGIPDGDLGAIKAGLLEPCKMVLVVRGDLNLSQSEIVSYCTQATLSCYKSLSNANKPLIKHWERTGQAKIALRAKSESQLLELEAIAKSLNLCARVVRRQNNQASEESTPTVLAIGPAPVELVNEVTGKLRLL